MSERIESFRDLNVYKKAFELQQEVFELTMRFPKEELYSHTVRTESLSTVVSHLGSAICHPSSELCVSAAKESKRIGFEVRERRAAYGKGMKRG